jgi:hypothetical protein
MFLDLVKGLDVDTGHGSRTRYTDVDIDADMDTQTWIRTRTWIRTQTWTRTRTCTPTCARTFTFTSIVQVHEHVHENVHHYSNMKFRIPKKNGIQWNSKILFLSVCLFLSFWQWNDPYVNVIKRVYNAIQFSINLSGKVNWLLHLERP